VLRFSVPKTKWSNDDGDRVAVLRESGEALPPPESRDFGLAFDRYGSARLVLLGEATHGTSEFYRARAAITRQLIEKHGFRIVAVEADWPDAARIDRYVRHLSPEPSREQAFARFPTWMWRNQEVREFVDWLREYNEPLPREARVEFRGLDVYSLGASMDAVLRFLDKVDPEEARRARERYGCLTPWQRDPAEYGAAALSGRADCEEEATAQLRELLDKRLEYEAKGDEKFFDAAQNARIVRAAEEYYRIMYHGSVASWNLRDRHMFDTLQRVMEQRGPDARAIVWAHNSHIGNAAATAMGWQGEFNIGELARTAYSDEMVAIGFGTDRGRVAAADAWGEPMRIMKVLPARDDSHEAVFRETHMARSLTDWRAPQRRTLREALTDPKLERAIGVIYRPQTEFMSHYFKAVLSEQFDAYVWFEETDAITPLGPAIAGELAETYPLGL
jgi:erythromycin esterase-like protein